MLGKNLSGVTSPVYLLLHFWSYIFLKLSLNWLKIKIFWFKRSQVLGYYMLATFLIKKIIFHHCVTGLLTKTESTIKCCDVTAPLGIFLGENIKISAESVGLFILKYTDPHYICSEEVYSYPKHNIHFGSCKVLVEWLLLCLQFKKGH